MVSVVMVLLKAGPDREAGFFPDFTDVIHSFQDYGTHLVGYLTGNEVCLGL